MYGTNLEDIFENIFLTQESQQNDTDARDCPLKHLEKKLSNFYYEEVNVTCSYQGKCRFRDTEFTDLIHVTFPEEAIIVDEMRNGLKKEQLAQLTGIPCYKYTYDYPIRQDSRRIIKYDYGLGQDESTPIRKVIGASKVTQEYMLEYKDKNIDADNKEEVEKFNHDKHYNVAKYFVGKLKSIFGDVEEKIIPGEKHALYIVIKSVSIRIEVRTKRSLGKDDREKSERDFEQINHSFQTLDLFKDEFLNYEDWSEEQECRTAIEKNEDQKYKNWITIIINFGNNEGPNIRFIMDARLRRAILSAANIAVREELGYKKVFYRQLHPEFSIGLPHEISECVRLKSLISISPEDNNSYPDILQVVDNTRATKCFVILQMKDYKVKFPKKLEEYRKCHGVPLIRLTFDFKSEVVHENHNPLCLGN